MSLDFDRKALRNLCERYQVQRLHLFGSVLTDGFDRDSDVDVLVEFPEDEKPGLFHLGGLQQRLTDLLGRPVDLKTPAFFDEADRRRILEESSVEYERVA